MRFRWKLLLLLIIIGLVPILAMRTFGVRAAGRLRDVLVSQTTETLIVNAESRLKLLVDSYAQMLGQSREMFEVTLVFQANQLEQSFTQDKNRESRFPLSDDFKSDNTTGSDEALAADPERLLSEYQEKQKNAGGVLPLILQVPGLTQGDRFEDINRLASLASFYHKLSTRLENFSVRHYTYLTNGLFSAYPGSGDIPENFDPGEQTWFKEAFEGDNPWTHQFQDPLTGQNVIALSIPLQRPDGRPAGVTALTIPTAKLFEHNSLIQNIPSETRSFIVYLDYQPQTGKRGARIMAREEYSDGNQHKWRTLVKAEWLLSDDDIQYQAVLDDFKLGKSNIRRIKYKQCDCLWVYGPIHKQGYLVLITPYTAILEPALGAEASIQSLLDDLVSVTRFAILGILAVVVILAFAFSRTVTKPMQILAEAAQKLGEGNLKARVDIHSRDEFGQMGKVFNQVIVKLEDHYQMQLAMDLAKEVQQNLLPRDTPALEGLDVAGRSLYCDETGGDYFDYLAPALDHGHKLGFVVGDVSGHGIPSALLMTTTRALMRQRVSMGGSITRVLADVNYQLAKDVKESGQFVTLFYGEVDMQEMKFRWVRAGHEPAVFYDAQTDTFEELGGRGMALAVSADADFEEQERDIAPGQIIVMGTDGIWEAHNSSGDMFGKDPLYKCIRGCSHKCAREILDSVLNQVEDFRRPLTKREDDMTLVVIKIGD